MPIRTKRIYDPPAESDGLRVLIDRLWPRGITQQQAALDHWHKDLAPSPDLRKWFAHDPDKFEEFKESYRDELNAQLPAAQSLLASAKDQPLTLLYAAKDKQINHAVVLKNWLEEI